VPSLLAINTKAPALLPLPKTIAIGMASAAVHHRCHSFQADFVLLAQELPFFAPSFISPITGSTNQYHGTNKHISVLNHEF
jgi:hypothetical protein